MAILAGKGTTIYCNSAASTTLVVLGQVTSITPHAAETGSVETTDLDQTWRTHRQTGVSAGGVCTFSINYDPTSTTGERLKTLITTPTTVLFRVFPPGSTSYPEFGGIVSGFAPGALTVDGLHTADITVQITGLVSFVTP
jgi:hypothetical protein